MTSNITFNSEETQVILNWYENAKMRSERFGSSRYYFPEEEIVLFKLKSLRDQQFDPIDTEIIQGWMEKAIGISGIYFPQEKELLEKINKYLED
jgi:hypothetical protein